MSDSPVLTLNENSEETLPFSLEKQDALLGHLLKPDTFFIQSMDKVKPEWFFHVYSTRLLQEKVNYYNKNKCQPTLAELRNLEIWKEENQQFRNALFTKLDIALHQSNEFKLNVIANELGDFVKSRIYYDAVSKSVPLYNNKYPEKAYSIIEAGMRKIRETDFTHDHEVTFTNYKDTFEKQILELDDALSFGCSVVDQLIEPRAKYGSLIKGKTTCLLAPINTGKTRAMITIACHNIRRGHPVLFITHEDTSDEIQNLIWCNLLNVTPVELFKMYDDPKDGMKKMNFHLQWINRFLTYLSINRAGLTVEEVSGIIRKYQERRMAEHNGVGYSLVIDDYPAKLTTVMAQHGNLQKRNIDGIVYNYFVQLALEYNFHSLVAIQTNREGSKVNKKLTSDRLLYMEDVQESWEAMAPITNVISINRDPVAEMLGFVTYNLCKTRTTKKGYAAICKSDYGRCRTHSDDLGATYYCGTTTYSNKVNELLAQGKNVFTGKESFPITNSWG
jgi:hypothetical protein